MTTARLVYSVPMNKDSAFLPSLLPLAVFFTGLDMVNGWPVRTLISSFLSQNGF